MTVHRWKTEIELENPVSGAHATVATVEEAAEALSHAWPIEGGSQHIRADNICHQAMEDGAPSDAARQAFIAAAIEAHFHIK